MRFQVLLLALCLLASPGAVLALSAQASAPVPAPANAEMMLLPGDMVRISVWRVPELSGQFVVTPAGYLEHPLYRHVQVVGVPVATVEERLRQYLMRFEANPEVVVQPLMRVWVAGEVRSPTMLTVPPGTNLEQVVMAAGGPTERSRLDRIAVYRDGERIIADMTDFDPRMRDFYVQSGDKVVVARRRSIMRDYVAPVASVIGAVTGIIRVTRILR